MTAYLCANPMCPVDAEWFHPKRVVGYCHDHYPLRDIDARSPWHGKPLEVSDD